MFRILYNPTLEGHCLFACFLRHFGFQENDGMEQAVYILRDRIASAWEQMGERSVLGMTLQQLASANKTSPRAYCAGLRNRRWGGFREALLASALLDIPVTIWSSSCQVLVESKGSWFRKRLHLCYAKNHYVLIQSPRGYRYQLSHGRKLGAGGTNSDGSGPMRARIAQKVASQGTPSAQQLVQLLWQANQPALKDIKGSNEEVHKEVMMLAKKEGYELREERWVRTRVNPENL